MNHARSLDHEIRGAWLGRRLIRIVTSRQVGVRAIRSASGATTRSSIVRRSGRAPSFASWPSTASRARAAGVISSAEVARDQARTLAQLRELELDDALERGGGERAERDDRIEPAEQLGPEELADRAGVIGGAIGIGREAGGRADRRRRGSSSSRSPPSGSRRAGRAHRSAGPRRPRRAGGRTRRRRPSRSRRTARPTAAGGGSDRRGSCRRATA